RRSTRSVRHGCCAPSSTARKSTARTPRLRLASIVVDASERRRLRSVPVPEQGPSAARAARTAARARSSAGGRNGAWLADRPLERAAQAEMLVDDRLVRGVGLPIEVEVVAARSDVLERRPVLEVELVDALVHVAVAGARRLRLEHLLELAVERVEDGELRL